MKVLCQQPVLIWSFSVSAPEILKLQMCRYATRDYSQIPVREAMTTAAAESWEQLLDAGEL